MIIALARLQFSLPGVTSLKGKRSLVNKLVEKARARFNVAAAEVEQSEVFGRAMLGFALVSNDRSHAQQKLDALVAFLEGASEAMVADAWMDVFSVDELALMGEPTLADAEGLKRDWDEDVDDRRKRQLLEELRKNRDR